MTNNPLVEALREDGGGTASIIQRVRNEGYQDGWSQGCMVAYDDAYTKGQTDLTEQHWRECKRWWWFGLLCGISAAVLVGAFV